MSNPVIPSDFLQRTYAGLAYKVGGGMIARFDLVHGALVRLDAPNVLQEFQILNIQIGACIGGGIGTMAVFAFNCPHIIYLDNKDVGAGSWSLDVDIGTKLDTLVKAPRYAHFLLKLAQSGIHKPLDDLVTLRNFAWDAYGVMANASSTEPSFVSFGIPGAGTGAQISLVYGISGRFEYLQQYIDHGEQSSPDRGEPGYDGAHGRGNY